MLLSHMHPAVSNGGAEIAAYQMFGRLRDTRGVRATFVAASGGRLSSRLGVVFSQPYGAGEYVYCGEQFDHFNHANMDIEFPPAFASLLKSLRPDVLHFHHYANFGVECFLLIKRYLPDAVIVLTLHEYLAICHHYGQMVKRSSFQLCSAAGNRECAMCFPEKQEIDFFLRRQYIQRFFRLVDHFVSPSQFLADRYKAWGVPAEKISVIENGSPDVSRAPKSARRGPSRRGSAQADLRIGFFGQISRLKGMGVLIDAAKWLERTGEQRIRFDIHGDYSGQPPEFREEFEAWLREAPPGFRYFGPYQHSTVHDLMLGVDAVVVPSVWWENSPLVIQEAKLVKRPLIVSDIGGMAEKVRDGLDGFHFRAGDPLALASLIRELADEPERLRALQRSIGRPASLKETTVEVLELYRRLCAARSDAAPIGFNGVDLP